MGGSRGGTGGPDPLPPEKSQKYRVSWQYWSGSPENHKATKPVFDVGPPSARQRNAIRHLYFKRRFAGGPMMTLFCAIWILFPLIKKRCPLAKLSGSAHVSDWITS